MSTRHAPWLRRVAAVFAIAVTATASQAFAQGLTKIRLLMPIAQIDEIFSPFLIAKEVGYFRDEGLDVDIIAVAGAKAALIQLASGNAEMAVIQPPDLMAGQQPPNNMPVQLVYDMYYQNIWSVAVPTESPIKSVDELKGRKIGVAAMGSTAVTYGKAFLDKVGLQVPRDAQFLAIGVGGQGATAVRSKAVDAVIYWDAMYIKLSQIGLGLRFLPTDEKLRSLPDASLGARLDFIDKNPKAVIGIGRALAKGYIFNQANPEAAIRITWKQVPTSKALNVPEDKALKNAIAVNQTRMKIWVTPKTNVWGKFIDSDWQNLVAFAKQYGLVDPKADVSLARLYTERFVPDFNKFDRDAVIAQAKAWK